MYGDVVMTGKLLLKLRYQVPVNFDEVQFGTCIQQWPCQCCLARTDFNQKICWLRCDACNDPIDYALIMQKILTKSFTGPVFHKGKLVSG
jgi:hypothetical protein